MKRIATLLITLAVIGCGKHQHYYRKVSPTGSIYWMEVKRTTFHGICATMYFGHADSIWVVEHPFGQEKMSDGTVGSADMDIKTFPTQSNAEAFAESVCPTR